MQQHAQLLCYFTHCALVTGGAGFQLWQPPPKKAMLHLPDGIALKVKLNVLLLALFCCGPVPRTTPTEVLSHSSGALLANSSLKSGSRFFLL